MQLLLLEAAPPSALHLQTILQKIDPTANIIAALNTADNAREWFQENPSPDLIFADLMLKDGSSLDLLREMGIDCPVIICRTASVDIEIINQINVVGCLSYPLSECCVENALNKVRRLDRFFQHKKGVAQKVKTDSAKIEYKTNFLVSQKDKLVPIAVADSACFAIEDDVVFIHTNDHRRFQTSHSLDELERLLNPLLFYRANRQCIIHKNAVVEIQHYFARKLLVKLKVPIKVQVIISKARASEFLQWMEA